MRRFHGAGFVALAIAVAFSSIDGAAARDQKQAPSPKETSVAAQPAPAAPVASEPAARPLDPKAAEIDGAFKAGLTAATTGPAQVALIDQAALRIPAKQAFIPKDEGLRILRALGNSPNAADMMGLVVGLADEDEWIIVVRYIKEGYIKDDDAKNWNADDLLSNIKDGTDEANKDREARGFSPIEVLGWIEKPTYDSASRRLVWSLLSKTRGASDNEAKGVNYNTYALGRDGYFSLNMLTDSVKVERYKPVAKTLLANLDYNPGKRYEDFNASTDQVAAYGLAALVGGVAAKKLGLFALGAAFFVKFAKVIFLAVAGLGVAATKFFKRGQSA
jgi:uncharacterized membrane-anchored protein